MAKKKAEETTKDELDDEFFGDDSESLKDLQEEDASLEVVESAPSAEDTPADTDAEDLSSLLEEEIILKDYKHLTVEVEQDGDERYVITIDHQSHGFMNYFVSKILKVKGVTFAAYKLTSLEPAKLKVHLDGSKDILTVMKESQKLMSIEWKGLSNAFAAMKI